MTLLAFTQMTPKISTDIQKHTLLALVLCSAVILAGCGGIGGSTNGSGGETADAGAAGGDDITDGATASNDPEADSAGESTSSNSQGASNSEADSNSGGETDATTGSNGGEPASSRSSNPSESTEGDWLNVSKPGKYVFEIENDEGESGEASFETTKVTNGKATVTVKYELGDESSEQTVTGPVGDVTSQFALSPAYLYLAAAQVGGFGTSALAGGENLEVGNEFSRQSEGSSLNIKVTGTDSYAGVDCYVVKTKTNGTLTQQICTPKPGSSAPYVARYDENGTFEQRIELIEYERN